MHLIQRPLLFLWGMVSIVPVFAADFWLRPERFVATPGATVGAEIASFRELPLSNWPTPSRVAVSLSGSEVPVGLDSSGENQRGPRVSATFVRPGWAIWSIDLSPPVESLSRSELGLRLSLFHAPPFLRERAARLGDVTDWRVASQSTLKCIARIGEPDPSDRSWCASSGIAWDLVPLTAPSELRVGGNIEFLVSAAGRPAAGTVVTLNFLSGERELVAQTDPAGRVSVAIPVAGLWQASAFHVQFSAGDDSLLEVRSTSLVFEAK